MDAKIEDAHLQLLSDMQAELAAALASLNATNLKGVKGYSYQMSAGVSDLSAGFLILKKARNNHAARILIRTGIETALKLAAVHEKPATLYRIAYTEHEGDRKFLGAADENKIKITPELIAAKWQKLRLGLAPLFPGEALEDSKISTPELSVIGKMPGLYDFQYRLYCNSTHATLRAHASPESFIPAVDYLAVAQCLYAALVVIQSLGGNCPQIQTYTARIGLLSTS